MALKYATIISILFSVIQLIEAQGSPEFQNNPQYQQNSTSVPVTPTSATPYTRVTEAPSGSRVLINDKVQLPTASLATKCSSDYIPFQTAFWYKGSQVDLYGSTWFKSQGTLNWTVWTETPGVNFSKPFVPNAQDPDSGAAQVPFKVTNHTLPYSFDFSTGDLGDLDAIMWFVSYEDGAVNVNQSNSSKRDSEEVLFDLNIAGYGVCPYPIRGNSTCRSGGVELSVDNWMAYQVDDFLKNWTSSKNHKYSSSGMMEDLKNDFRIQTDVCSVQKPCPALQSCTNQKDPDGDNAVAIFLAYSAMANLANFFNMIYSNVLTDSQLNANNIAKVVQTFFPDPNAKVAPDTRSSKVPSPLPLEAASVGMASFGLMAIPEIGPIVGGIAGLVSGALGIAGIKKDQQPPTAPTPQPPPPPSQFADLAQLSSNVQSTIVALQSTIELWQWATLSNGTNVPEIFAGGGFVNRSVVEFGTGQTSQAAAWLEQYLTVKLINYAWWTQNVFIAFMPYGQDIHEWASHQGDEHPFLNTTQVDETLCKQKDAYNQVNPSSPISVYMCDTYDIFAGSNIPEGGMARLAWYSKTNLDYKSVKGCNVNNTQKDAYPYLDLTKSPVGFDKHPTFSSSGGQYTFNALDVVNSSLRSFIAGGYNYDFATDVTNQTASTVGQKGALASLAGLKDGRPSDAGMFNLPVVIVRDMWYWPNQLDWQGWDAFSMVAQGQADYWKTPLVSNTTLPPDFLDFCNTSPAPTTAPQCAKWRP